jgi:hypothetical protein
LPRLLSLQPLLPLLGRTTTSASAAAVDAAKNGEQKIVAPKKESAESQQV